MTIEESASARAFQKTRVSMVRELGEGNNRAWDEFYSAYKGPLTTYLRYKINLSNDLAAVLLQNFLGDKSQKATFFSAWKPEKGKFRNYLLTSFVHYVISELRKTHPLTPEQEDELREIYEHPKEAVVAKEWTRAVIAATLERIRSHYEDEDKVEFWLLFLYRVLNPKLDGTKPPNYGPLLARVEKETGRTLSLKQAPNVVLDGKRTFKRFLRKVVKETEKQPDATPSQIQLVKHFLDKRKKKSKQENQ